MCQILLRLQLTLTNETHADQDQKDGDCGNAENYTHGLFPFLALMGCWRWLGNSSGKCFTLDTVNGGRAKRSGRSGSSATTLLAREQLPY